MKIKPFFRWYDLWIGAYWDRSSRALYICPLPMIGLKISFSEGVAPGARANRDAAFVMPEVTDLPTARVRIANLEWHRDNLRANLDALLAEKLRNGRKP